MLSWADTSASFFFRAKLHMEGYSVEGAESQIMALGIQLKFKKKGAYPVLADLAELMANSMAGSLVTQSFWFG